MSSSAGTAGSAGEVKSSESAAMVGGMTTGDWNVVMLRGVFARHRHMRAAHDHAEAAAEASYAAASAASAGSTARAAPAAAAAANTPPADVVNASNAAKKAREDFNKANPPLAINASETKGITDATSALQKVTELKAEETGLKATTDQKTADANRELVKNLFSKKKADIIAALDKAEGEAADKAATMTPAQAQAYVGVWNLALTGITAALDWVLNALKQFFNTVIHALEAAWEWVKGAFNSAVNWIKNIF